jgi:hypothetical protein
MSDGTAAGTLRVTDTETPNSSNPSNFLSADKVETPPAGLADAGIIGGYVNAAHDTTAQVLTGTAAKGVTVAIFDGATELGTTTADPSTGAWSFTLGKLADGTHSLAASAIDAAGNAGSPSGTLAFIVDTQAPAAPAGLADAAISGGHVAASANTASQQLTGTTEAGATVAIYDGAKKLGSVAADATTGVWSYTLGKLSAGAHSLTATATDLAGNTGTASTALTFAVDPSTGPAVPSGLTDTAIVGGYVNKAGDTASQLLTGVADAGVTITVYDKTTKLGTTTADATTGDWSYTLGQLKAGAHSLTAKASDAGGHVSPASAALAFTVDTAAPAPPSTLADASIVKSYVNAASDTAGQLLTGKAASGATVTIYDGGTQLGTATASSTGVWSYTLGHLSEGSHSLTATATDAAGNTGVSSKALAFKVDTAAPSAPAGLGDAGIVGGYVNAAHDTTGQKLTGTAEAGATVTVYDGATKLGAAVASSTGAWSYALGKLLDGAHSLTATATDAAGNLGPSGAALSFTVDTQIPSANVANVIVGPPSTTLSLSGMSEPGASVSVAEGATKLGSAIADADGAWSVTLSGLANKLHKFTVSASDAAGNKATAAAAFYDPASNVAITGTTAGDLLIGRPGDTLTGGAGADRFVFGSSPGQETITDFTPSSISATSDVLQIDHTLSPSFTDLMSHATQAGADVSISLPSGSGLLLQNVQLLSLHAGDFVFV